MEELWGHGEPHFHLKNCNNLSPWNLKCWHCSLFYSENIGNYYKPSSHCQFTENNLYSYVLPSLHIQYPNFASFYLRSTLLLALWIPSSIISSESLFPVFIVQILEVSLLSQNISQYTMYQMYISNSDLSLELQSLIAQLFTYICLWRHHTHLKSKYIQNLSFGFLPVCVTVFSICMIEPLFSWFYLLFYFQKQFVFWL